MIGRRVSHMVPLAFGTATFVAVEAIDSFLLKIHLSAEATLLDNFLLGLLVVCLVTVLQQRFHHAFVHLQGFTSDMAHQLRTPLAIMQSTGELGLQGSRTEDQLKETIDSMLEEVDRMTRLVGSLLLIARIDAGALRLDRTRIRIADLVQEVTSILEVLAQDKAQVLSVDTADDGLVSADRTMLRQVLINLIDNAIKYTPRGGTIAVKTHASSRALEVSVTDSGPGIPPQDQRRIFERFYRLSANPSGTGLGLPICKWIVEAHRGKISCRSGAGGGCKFTVQLPMSHS